jgi:hypothetical protein
MDREATRSPRTLRDWCSRSILTVRGVAAQQLTHHTLGLEKLRVLSFYRKLTAPTATQRLAMLKVRGLLETETTKALSSRLQRSQEYRPERHLLKIDCTLAARARRFLGLLAHQLLRETLCTRYLLHVRLPAHRVTTVKVDGAVADWLRPVGLLLRPVRRLAFER